MPAEQHGRPAQAGGQGRFSARHDLETRNVPYLHGSDLQYGEVSEMRAAQSALGPRTQQSAQPAPAVAPQRSTMPQQAGVPDPISFFSGRKQDIGTDIDMQGDFQIKAWMPFANAAMNGANASSMLRRLFVRQVRNANMASQRVVHIDQTERDAALFDAFGLE